jgi:O-antigen biosynthesis protein
MNPRISIVNPVFNQAAYTAACLDALAKDEEVRTSAEVIVVDNASSDDTRDVLEGAKAKLP